MAGYNGTFVEFFEWSNRDKRLDEFPLMSSSWPTGMSNYHVMPAKITVTNNNNSFFHKFIIGQSSFSAITTWVALRAS